MFEIYTPAKLSKSIEMGYVTIDTCGNVRFNSVDFQTNGIEDRVTVLIDKGTKRLGFRKPRDGETSLKIKWSKSKNSLAIGLVGAFKQIELNPKNIKGTYKLDKVGDV